MSAPDDFPDTLAGDIAYALAHGLIEETPEGYTITDAGRQWYAEHASAVDLVSSVWRTKRGEAVSGADHHV